MSEQEVQKYLLNELNKLGVFIKTITNTKSGYPDIVGCISGIFFAIEVKSSIGKPTDLQVYRIQEFRKNNGEACIVYGMEGAKRLLTDIRMKKKLEWEYK